MSEQIFEFNKKNYTSSDQIHNDGEKWLIKLSLVTRLLKCVDRDQNDKVSLGLHRKSS